MVAHAQHLERILAHRGKLDAEPGGRRFGTAAEPSWLSSRARKTSTQLCRGELPLGSHLRGQSGSDLGSQLAD